MVSCLMEQADLLLLMEKLQSSILWDAQLSLNIQLLLKFQLLKSILKLISIRYA